ncbi:MAG: hypothetical protein NT071_11195 [Burkholderiales bacterium]|nr:hypothetical protein [Burkholderiales bacterium]
MRRDTFLKSLAALAAGGALPMSALAAANLKMMIPANPGGGWDGTGRALGKALLEAKVAVTVTYENKGGAAGELGLAQFVNASKGDPNAIMIMGAVMLGGIITGKPPVSLSVATPLVRLTSEYNVFVLPTNSPFKSMKDVIEQLKKDGINIPTLKELGYNVEIGNWRGVYGAPGITAAQRKALTDMLLKAAKTKSWAADSEKNNWTAAVMSGKEFEDFVDNDFASLRATMVKAGMI